MRVLLVDDNRDVRTLMKRIVLRDDEITLVGEAENGRDAIDLVEEADPDVVVMDVEMPVLNGIDATREIRSRFPAVRVLACSANAERSLTKAMARAGASAHLEKSKAGVLLIPLLKAIGLLERSTVVDDSE